MNRTSVDATIAQRHAPRARWKPRPRTRSGTMFGMSESWKVFHADGRCRTSQMNDVCHNVSLFNSAFRNRGSCESARTIRPASTTTAACSAIERRSNDAPPGKDAMQQVYTSSEPAGAHRDSREGLVVASGPPPSPGTVRPAGTSISCRSRGRWQRERPARAPASARDHARAAHSDDRLQRRAAGRPALHRGRLSDRRRTLPARDACGSERDRAGRAARRQLAGGTAYCTHEPCVDCSKLLISAGIVRIVYETAYPDPVGTQLLDEAGVDVEQFAGSVTCVA